MVTTLLFVQNIKRDLPQFSWKLSMNSIHFKLLGSYTYPRFFTFYRNSSLTCGRSSSCIKAMKQYIWDRVYHIRYKICFLQLRQCPFRVRQSLMFLNSGAVMIPSKKERQKKQEVLNKELFYLPQTLIIISISMQWIES